MTPTPNSGIETGMKTADFSGSRRLPRGAAAAALTAALILAAAFQPSLSGSARAE